MPKLMENDLSIFCDSFKEEYSVISETSGVKLLSFDSLKKITLSYSKAYPNHIMCNISKVRSGIDSGFKLESEKINSLEYALQVRMLISQLFELSSVEERKHFIHTFYGPEFIKKQQQSKNRHHQEKEQISNFLSQDSTVNTLILEKKNIINEFLTAGFLLTKENNEKRSFTLSSENFSISFAFRKKDILKENIFYSYQFHIKNSKQVHNTQLSHDYLPKIKKLVYQLNCLFSLKVSQDFIIQFIDSNSFFRDQVCKTLIQEETKKINTFSLFQKMHQLYEYAYQRNWISELTSHFKKERKNIEASFVHPLFEDKISALGMAFRHEYYICKDSRIDYLVFYKGKIFPVELKSDSASWKSDDLKEQKEKYDTRLKEKGLSCEPCVILSPNGTYGDKIDSWISSLTKD